MGSVKQRLERSCQYPIYLQQTTHNELRRPLFTIEIGLKHWKGEREGAGLLITSQLLRGSLIKTKLAIQRQL